jgi:hypothetical protein
MKDLLSSVSYLPILQGALGLRSLLFQTSGLIHDDLMNRAYDKVRKPQPGRLAANPVGQGV